MEFGHHQRALNDILFCFRIHFDNNGNANNVLSIFWQVRINLTLKLILIHMHPYPKAKQHKTLQNLVTCVNTT